MELLSYPKTDYLLEAALESLHAESVAWSKEIEFWGDEISFFYKLLHGKKTSKTFPSQQGAEIDKELVKLNGERLDKVKSGVESHERLLASAFKSPTAAEEQVYREAHRKLLGEMHGLHKDIRSIKRRIFSFVEN